MIEPAAEDDIKQKLAIVVSYLTLAIPVNSNQDWEFDVGLPKTKTVLLSGLVPLFFHCISILKNY